jgi:short-subunit dehydrogenase
MEQRDGTILNVSSIGAFGTEPGIGYYNATKAAAVYLTRRLA